MGIPMVTVDAFTETPFAGNPAAVCVLGEARDAAWMQAVAREMTLSETAFLVPGADGFQLRWFMPTVEADLCGHATLASAHVLWEAGFLPPAAAARFQTRSGLLIATRRGARIEMDFPATPEEPASPPLALAKALGLTPVYVGKNRFDCLGPFWRARLGKDEFVAYQASARGGVVCVRVQGDRVIPGGGAVTVLRGELV